MKNKEDKKCKKGQESTIGKIIYGFILFMPLIAIFSTILINTFNTNAKQETKIIYKYETNKINSFTDMIQGNVYAFSNSDTIITQQDLEEYANEGFYITGTLLKFGMNKYNQFSADDTDYTTPEFNKVGEFTLNSSLGIFLPGGQEEGQYLTSLFSEEAFEDQDIYFDFILQNMNIPANSQYTANMFSCFSSSNYNEIENVETTNVVASNVFYEALEKAQNSPLFNWSRNSVVYTTLSNTCNGLSITNTFIPFIFSYMLIVSVIYFLYDIALMLIWTIHNKIHELQESI